MSYFHRIKLAADAEQTPAFWRAFMNDGYALHQAVWTLFGDSGERTRDFLYRLEPAGRDTCIFAVSQRPIEADRRLWSVDTKSYDVVLRDGMRLGFRLRANATVTRKGRRHDVVMDLKKSKQTGDDRSESELAQEAGEAWLVRRSETRGFRVRGVRVDGYRVRALRGRGAKRLRFATLDFEGVLDVTNAAAFRDVLYHGMGRARAFGCGLMMVRRVNG